MKYTAFDLNDLKPAKATIQLSSIETPLHLKPFSLAARIWFKEKYKDLNKIQDIFEGQDWREISEIAYYLLEEKEIVKSAEELTEKMLTMADQLEVLNAIVRSIGVSQQKANELYKQQSEASKKQGAQRKVKTRK